MTLFKQGDTVRISQETMPWLRGSLATVEDPCYVFRGYATVRTPPIQSLGYFADREFPVRYEALTLVRRESCPH